MSKIFWRFFIRFPWLYGFCSRLRGRYNYEVLVLLNLIDKNQIVFDVGANRGHYTLLFSNIVGATGQIHAFEPVPVTYQLLSTHMKANKRYNNDFLNPLAVSESSGSITIHLPGTDDGQASMKPHDQGSWRQEEMVHKHECQMTTLDDYVHAKQLKNLGFIKCDVEGAELLVLKGAQQTLRTNSPMLFLEIYKEWMKAFHYSPADLVHFLLGLGYDTFFLIEEDIRRMSGNQLEDFPFSRSANLLCGKSEQHNFSVLEKYCLSI